MMEATFTVDDPDAFYQPWTGMRALSACAARDHRNHMRENNQHLFDYHIPAASKRFLSWRRMRLSVAALTLRVQLSSVRSTRLSA